MDHLEDQESASESLNVYPEACASAMLETARLSVSLEGDEFFRVRPAQTSNSPLIRLLELIQQIDAVFEYLFLFSTFAIYSFS